jgi:hypothetical protein
VVETNAFRKNQDPISVIGEAEKKTLQRVVQQ